MSMITPRPMSGFPELLPDHQLVLNRCIDTIRRRFELSGFTPIETPSVERVDVLTSKGGEEKEIYGIRRLAAEAGESEVEFALHFDLTVPLARYVAQYKEQLVFPFRRYQIQKVWRGERPQKGRYREFYQCDIDIIGRNTLGLLNDAEVVSVIHGIFTELKFGAFVVRINNRRLLQGCYRHYGIDAANIPAVLRIVDKLDKIGRDKVISELTEKLGLTADVADGLLGFAELDMPTEELLAHLATLPMMADEGYASGLAELSEVTIGIRSLGVPDESFRVDLRIARGLGYYTGTIYETTLTDHRDLGSVCSGGRYDDLASYFTNDKLPGVGISIGLSRLVFVLLERGVLTSGAATPARVLVTVMDSSRTAECLAVAARLRADGVATEVFLEHKKGLGDQLKYASKKGFPFVVIAGPDELDAGVVKLKDMSAGTEITCAPTELSAHVRIGAIGG
jgi:histidyl-tRNA synthetase